MCVKGWKMDRFNPAKIPVITHEMEHRPEFLDLRGGPQTAGTAECDYKAQRRSCGHSGSYGVECYPHEINANMLQELILRIASGQEDIEEFIVSDIETYASRVPIDD
jgi:phospholipid:diacylglycerol acyltransferase